MIDWPDGHLANVLVPHDAPQYADMVDKAKGYPGKMMFPGQLYERLVDARYFYRHDDRGIMVPLEWLR